MKRFWYNPEKSLNLQRRKKGLMERDKRRVPIMLSNKPNIHLARDTFDFKYPNWSVILIELMHLSFKYNFDFQQNEVCHLSGNLYLYNNNSKCFSEYIYFFSLLYNPMICQQAYSIQVLLSHGLKPN